MIHFTDMTGLAGIALACAVAVSSLARQRQALLMMGGMFVAMLLPWDGLPLAAYVRGMIGDLSVTSLLLLGFGAVRRCNGRPAGAAESSAAWALLALTAAAFYPLALGATALDPYRWGYGEPIFLGVLLMVAIAGNLSRLPFIAPAISLAVLAWAAGWYESTNLWDYLLDPLLAIYAMGRLVTMTLRRGKT